MGRIKKSARSAGSGEIVLTADPRAEIRIPSGSIPTAVQSPERKPSPMTNCQMKRWNFFAMG
ncbi:MAG: hypothetical protein WB986_07175, partial [Methanoregula sp.]|uniref:hypothetical protein n=1 Tax=Methanoregula sp. TaxID=2052170 RepID=UPI003C35F77F